MSLQLIAPGVPLLLRRGVTLLSGPLPAGSPAQGTGGTGSGTGATGAVGLVDLAILVVGQSNANYTFYPTIAGQTTSNDQNYAGLGPTTTTGLKFWSRAAASEIAGIGATMFQGQGLYDGTAGGSWLANPNGTALYRTAANSATWIDPSTWTWGSPDGTSFTTYIASLTAEEIAAMQALWWYWGENDSSRAYAEKATFKSALLRFVSLTRGLLGKTPAQLPLLLWSCMPSVGSDQGMCMVREVVFEIIADAANCAYLVLGQAADCNPRGSTANSDGTVNVGGDTYHAQDDDYGRWVRRATQPIVQALFTAQGASQSIPVACGSGLGPFIADVSISGNLVTVSVQHDIGTDLKLAQQALAGIGWTVMDGGSAALPGVLIPATSCARIDATRLAITLAGIPCNPPGACRLFYPYGNTRIGTGNAVTDNASKVVRPSGWDPASVLGDSLFDQDMPLQMPVALAGGVAACGVPLAQPVVSNTGPYSFNQDAVLPAAGSFTHGVGTLTCAVDDLSGSGYAAPEGAEFGITSSLAELPTVWTAASRYQTTLWTAYVPMPAAAGIYYLVAQSVDANGSILARVTGSAFAVS